METFKWDVWTVQCNRERYVVLLIILLECHVQSWVSNLQTCVATLTEDELSWATYKAYNIVNN